MLTVSQLNAQVKKLLTNHFPLVVVEGEISGMSRHAASGHYYFNLKDERAVLGCVMFARSAARLPFQPKEGLKVLVRAEISLYERGGRYQAVIQHMEPRGEGELRLAMERLRAKLQAMGWFEDELKKPLPTYPKRIVIVSSPTGAATRDVFVNIWRRYPAIQLSIQPTSVQGQFAVHEICQAIATINKLPDRPDFAILTRGGGSLEDLAAFNSEEVASAIHQSEIPVVSAVGHDVDFTIADFVADLRAPTPSTAAELVTPDGKDLGIRFDDYAMVLEKNLRAKASRDKTIVAHITRRLRDPQRELVNNLQKLNDLMHRLKRTQTQIIVDHESRLVQLRRALNQAKPSVTLEHFHTKLNVAQSQLWQLTIAQGKVHRSRVNNSIEKLSQLDTQLRGRTQTQFLNFQRALIQARPKTKINHLQTSVESLKARLRVRIAEHIQLAINGTTSVSKNLEAVSPLAVLSRGYAVVSKPKPGTLFGEITKSVVDLHPDESIATHLSDGTVYAKVTDVVLRDYTTYIQTSRKDREE